MTKKLKIVFMGTPDFACSSLKYLAQEHQVVAVVTTADQKIGRGQKLQSVPVKLLAEYLNIPVLTPENLQDPSFIEQLKMFKADVFVVVAFKMLPAVVFKIPPLGTINLHGSLLPEYRGAAPLQWAIINQEKITGLTTFFIEEKMDTGAILEQNEIPLDSKETSESLHHKMAEKGAFLLDSTLKKLQAGTLKAKVQDVNHHIILKKAPKIFKEHAKLDFNQPASVVEALIRGMYPTPGAWCTALYNQKKVMIKILSADHLMQPILEPGQVKWDTHQLWIGCKTGTLTIKELQVEGKNRVFIADFLRGCQNFELEKI